MDAGCIRARFARRGLSALHDTERAIGFSVLCYVLAGMIVVLGAILAALVVGEVAAIVSIALVLALVVAGNACEIAIAITLATLVPPARWSRADNFAFWRGLTHYTGGFIDITALWFVAMYFAGMTNLGNHIGTLAFLTGTGTLRVVGGSALRDDLQTHTAQWATYACVPARRTYRSGGDHAGLGTRGADGHLDVTTSPARTSTAE